MTYGKQSAKTKLFYFYQLRTTRLYESLCYVSHNEVRKSADCNDIVVTTEGLFGNRLRDRYDREYAPHCHRCTDQGELDCHSLSLGEVLERYRKRVGILPAF